ncbi:tetraacyldisaccharide 4'-kinase [Polynucleobacter wuianus]|uniref:Tetraacyldisaccharide 4'-kinase n=1 Tax=Polynucleobacter wuianus TaxID=1743168 RepID=A0A191UDB5_9BURK|nr:MULTISPECIES: tetraacyldisaccharide 4'-kinase [Polynucleobacter]ANI98890.1 tetraacyldisaccharide 4'-kinase [Polynucleobacter wuianus]MBU3553710.1 tetraacyldisaccharide 4'-kinase [Polynucleobacter sp. MWH-Post4-6-1]
MALSIFRKAPKFWERRGPTSLVLWPLSWLYGIALRIRRLIHDLDLSKIKPAPVPIIIIGNIRVGGTGKTPIVIALAEQLSQLGWKPGIISRGYGASSQIAPVQVKCSSDPSIVGDEPVLIAKRTSDQFPIWVFPKRQQSIKALLKHFPEVNVIISDDGLQHHGLIRWPAREGGRDVEFVVRDDRGEGNRFLLPAGPLREPATPERDATLFTGTPKNQKSGILDEYFLGRRSFNLASCLGTPYQLINPSNTQSFEQITEQYLPKNIAAIAGLGNPKRFFDDLARHAVTGKQIPLPDHVAYTSEFFASIKAQCILITEKDAVKCTGISDERIWVVPMSLHLPDNLMEWLQSILQRPDPRRYTL